MINSACTGGTQAFTISNIFRPTVHTAHPKPTLPRNHGKSVGSFLATHRRQTRAIARRHSKRADQSLPGHPALQIEHFPVIILSDRLSECPPAIQLRLFAIPRHRWKTPRGGTSPSQTLHVDIFGSTRRRVLVQNGTKLAVDHEPCGGRHA